MNKSCFTEQDLRNYALGTSDDATSDEIERHLAECPACEETLADLACEEALGDVACE